MSCIVCSQLEKVPVPPEPLTLECHWFERVNVQSGEVYSLKSVVETPQYVTIQTDGSPLSLTTEPRQCLLIKDERVSFHSVKICRLAKNLQGKLSCLPFEDKLLWFGLRAICNKTSNFSVGAALHYQENSQICLVFGLKKPA